VWQVYLPVTEENCFMRDQLVTEKTCVVPDEHPIYTLLLLTPETIVRERLEDHSKKLYSIAQGAVVQACERAISGQGLMKYRLVDGGWLNAHRYGMQLGDVQVIVVDVSLQCVGQASPTSTSDTSDISPPTATQGSEGATHTPLKTAQQRSEYQKLVGISPIRAGLLVSYRFQCRCVCYI
jgi:hypothetical protein